MPRPAVYKVTSLERQLAVFLAPLRRNNGEILDQAGGQITAARMKAWDKSSSSTRKTQLFDLDILTASTFYTTLQTDKWPLAGGGYSWEYPFSFNAAIDGATTIRCEFDFTTVDGPLRLLYDWEIVPIRPR